MKLKLDLHIHTSCSDGIPTPEEVVMHAKKIGLDGIAITDHDTMEGFKRAEKIAKKLNILLIPAAEITTPHGDILALGIKEIPKGKAIEIVNKIHKDGGIAIIAHPFAGYSVNSFAANNKLLSVFDAIEIYNAMTPLDKNLKAMELARNKNIPGIAASDAHYLEAVGAAFIVVNVKKPNIKEIFDKIKQGDINIGWV